MNRCARALGARGRVPAREEEEMNEEKVLEVLQPSSLREGRPWESEVTIAKDGEQLLGVMVWGEKELSGCFVYRENISKIIEQLKKILEEHPE
jgi:hypothetical protein